MDEHITYVGLDVPKETILVALAVGGRRGEVREHVLSEQTLRIEDGGELGTDPFDLKKHRGWWRWLVRRLLGANSEGCRPPIPK
ncbi:hypothetical protein NKH36_13920 [Mesorhizobium sp. M1312]|uniref:hypothetical protein n=1 Tax=unclassified Mesorhizobium TaxID=325217 RepID=UPI0033397C0F